MNRWRCRKSLWIAFVLVALVVSFSAPPAAEAQQAEPIRIGALFPFTGTLALLGRESFRGAEMAQHEWNAAGGVLGRPVEFVLGDAKDANSAISEAERLITRENVSVIIGTYSSSLSYAASQVAERHGVIYWELGAVADDITARGFKYLFRIAPRAREYGRLAADFTAAEIAQRLGKDVGDLRVAIIFEDGLYGTTVAKFARERAQELGLNVVAYEAYNTAATDLSSLVLRLRQRRPDVLWATQYFTDLLLFWRQSKELGLNIPVIIGTGGAHSNREFVDAVGAEEAEGVFNVAFASVGVNRAFAPKIDHARKLYEELYGAPPTSAYPIVNYDGTNFLFQAIEAAGSLDPEAIREAALAMNIPSNQSAGGWGAYFARPGSGEDGQNLHTHMIVDQWQGDEQIVVWPPEARNPGVEIIRVPR